MPKFNGNLLMNLIKWTSKIHFTSLPLQIGISHTLPVPFFLSSTLAYILQIFSPFIKKQNMANSKEKKSKTCAILRKFTQKNATSVGDNWSYYDFKAQSDSKNKRLLKIQFSIQSKTMLNKSSANPLCFLNKSRKEMRQSNDQNG